MIIPKTKIEKATMILMPSVGVGPFTCSVVTQLRVRVRILVGNADLALVYFLIA